jgi:outer membrane protein
MLRIAALILLCTLAASANQVRTLTLREAVDLALKQNPDLLLARLDSAKAAENVRVAKDPFMPKIYAGSGLAYSSGFPMSIEGATPSIFQARAVAFVYNRPQSMRVAAAKQYQRGAAMDEASRRSDVVYRTASLYVDANAAARATEVASTEVAAFQRALETVRARAAEGRALPLDVSQAELSLARAEYRLSSLRASLDSARRSLALVLGLDPAAEIRTTDEPLPAAIPEDVPAAIAAALQNSTEIRSLEARLVAKTYEERAAKGDRLPTLDLVAQYALLAKFNNYEEFFRTFQRNNGQLGVSITVPVFLGRGTRPEAAVAQVEADQLRLQIRSTRARIDADVRRAYDDLRQSQAARDLARRDLDVAREQVSVLLAQMQEGRAPLSRVEEARAAEAEKWIAYYDADATFEKARLNVLNLTGDLLAAIQ